MSQFSMISSPLGNSQLPAGSGRQNFLIAEYLINAITWIKHLRQVYLRDTGTPAGPAEQLIRSDTSEHGANPLHTFSLQSISSTCKEWYAHCTHTYTYTHTDSLNSVWLGVFIRTASLTAAGRVEGSYLRLSCALPLWRLIRKDMGRTQSGPVSPIRLPCCFPNATSPPLRAMWHCITIPPRSVLS